MDCEKIVLVTRRTRLEGLLERFPTRAQARFYLEAEGGDYGLYEAEHDAYHAAVGILRRSLELGPPVHLIDRAIVPTYMFTRTDLVVTAGQDGLVANTAKYAGGQPIIGVNPDPGRIDGILNPFSVAGARAAAADAIEGRARIREVTMAEARLADGSRLLAFNDFFIGARSHVSARYLLRCGGRSEQQSSSGVLVATGAGSTGWLSSCFNMAAGVAAAFGGGRVERLKLEWEDPRLAFVVREPFASLQSGVALSAGLIGKGETLVAESRMPSGGAVFSDGIEEDFLHFDSGAVVTVA
ncbi:MAG: NAD+ kinase, partial [Elusimicrobia bacterium]|nr:NAD+ kinase [Elusimicrobiota bacterium]